MSADRTHEDLVRQWADAGDLLLPGAGTGSSVHLTRAMALLCGVTGIEPDTQTRRYSELIGEHDSYLFVLVDGLGMNLTARFPRDGFFSTSFARSLRSVFPSTTAVALTTLATGAWPCDHGVCGWWTYYPEHRRVIAPLLFRERATDTPGEALGLTPADIIAGTSLLPRFTHRPVSFLPVDISTGAYAEWSRAGTPILPYGRPERRAWWVRSRRQQTRRHFRGVERLVANHFRRAPSPAYGYLYILTVDKAAHRYGIGSEEVREQVERVDRILSTLRDRLPSNVRMVVTADHGLVDVPPERRFVIRQGDAIDSLLWAGATGEATTPILHLRPDAEAAFRDAFAEHPASEEFALVRPDDLVRLGVLGPGSLTEAAGRHWGDLVGIAGRPAVIDYVPRGKEPLAHIGVHGGLRPGEIEVPLFLA